MFYNYQSPHPHLPVHEQGEEPVAEGGEFLGLVLEDESFGKHRMNGFAKVADNFRAVWDGVGSHHGGIDSFVTV